MPHPTCSSLALRIALLVAPLLLSTPRRAAAQAWRDLAVGVAVPTGAYAELRTVGPLVRGTVTCCQRQKHVTVRGELEGAAMFARARPSRFTSRAERGGAFTVGALASYVVGVPDSRSGPYAFLGLGLQALIVPGEEHPLVTPVGGRAGLGVRAQFRGMLLHAEIARHLAISAHGHAQEFEPVSYTPVVFGLSF